VDPFTLASLGATLGGGAGGGGGMGGMMSTSSATSSTETGDISMGGINFGTPQSKAERWAFVALMVFLVIFIVVRLSK